MSTPVQVTSPAAPHVRHTAPGPLFIALWVLWAALLAAAMVLGNVYGHASAVATAARMGSSVVLVITGWVAFALWRPFAIAPFAGLIALGMTLGCIGDFFNARLLDFVPLPDPVLGGIIAFGLGHIAYISGCVILARRARLVRRGPLLAAILAWQLVGIVGWWAVVYQGSEARPLVWPALPYSLLLAGTAGVTSGLAAQAPRLTALACGAALFLASDLILAFELFRGPFPFQTEAVWLTYGPGQMFIVFSTISAFLVLVGRGGPRTYVA